MHEAPTNRFPNSPWTMIASLKREDAPCRSEVIGELFRLYSKPIYAFAARRFPASDPSDLTQLTFEAIVATDCLGAADRDRGTFRTFLIQILKSVASKQWRREEQHRLALRIDADECRKFSEALVVPESEDPATQIDWLSARAALERAVGALREDYRARGRGRAFPILHRLSLDEPVDDAAGRLGLSEGALRVQVFRFRHALRAAFRNEVSRLGAGPAELDSEMRYLLGLLRRRGSL